MQVFEVSTNHRGGQQRGLYATQEAADRAAAEFVAKHAATQGYISVPRPQNWRWHLARIHRRLERRNLRFVNVLAVDITPREVHQ